ncbi:MAG: hypothetical protein EHM13_12600, partial [Acidobacteria bacterium]
MAIHIGIDLGSVSVKAALFTRDAAMAALFERHAAHHRFQSAGRMVDTAGRPCWLAVTSYSRIQGSPLKEARALL